MYFYQALLKSEQHAYHDNVEAVSRTILCGKTRNALYLKKVVLFLSIVGNPSHPIDLNGLIRFIKKKLKPSVENLLLKRIDVKLGVSI